MHFLQYEDRSCGPCRSDHLGSSCCRLPLTGGCLCADMRWITRSMHINTSLTCSIRLHRPAATMIGSRCWSRLERPGAKSALCTLAQQTKIPDQDNGALLPAAEFTHLGLELGWGWQGLLQGRQVAAGKRGPQGWGWALGLEGWGLAPVQASDPHNCNIIASRGRRVLSCVYIYSAISQQPHTTTIQNPE